MICNKCKEEIEEKEEIETSEDEILCSPCFTKKQLLIYPD